jgi:hypothetical protein
VLAAPVVFASNILVYCAATDAPSLGIRDGSRFFSVYLTVPQVRDDGDD